PDPEHFLSGFSGMVASFRHAGRSLHRAPSFAVAAVLTLAVGIGATSSIFAVLNAIVFKPLPYPQSDRLVGAWHALPGMKFDRAPQSTGTYFAYRALSRTLDGFAIWDRGPANLGGAGMSPERVPTTFASASLFPLLGVKMGLGRAFIAA